LGEELDGVVWLSMGLIQLKKKRQMLVGLGSSDRFALNLARYLEI
jgi:hypothetical protein